MILHVANLDKFIPPFLKLFDKELDITPHYFWLTGDKSLYNYDSKPCIYQTKPGPIGNIQNYVKLIFLLNRADKVFLHGLFSIKIVVLLSTMPWLLKKCHWIIVGGDLYARETAKKDWKWHTREPFRHFVIRHAGNLVTYIDGDVALARKWYGAKGKHQECLIYTSNLYSDLNLQENSIPPINIQLGNSADPSNNHIEILEKLLPYKNSKICIYAPLSYGNKDQYAENVIKRGSEWFGEKFQPLTDFMPYDEYLKFLSKIDIAAFNHKRQQGMGNIITLLGLGKKVFIRSDITPWATLKNKGLTIYDINNLEISPLEPEKKSQNQQIIKKHFSKEKLLSQLKTIFKD